VTYVYDDVTYVYDDVTYVYDDVTYVYDDVTYVYDDVTYVPATLASSLGAPGLSYRMCSLNKGGVLLVHSAFS